MKPYRILLDPAVAEMGTGVDTPPADAGALNDPELAQAFDNPFQSLDDKTVKKPDEPATPPAEKPDEKKPEPAAAKKDDAAKTPPPAKDDKKDKAAAPPAAKPVPKELKAHNEQLLKELREERSAKSELEKQIQAAKAAGESTAKLSQELAQSKKDIERLKGELGAAKFSVSDDFKRNHQMPWERAVKRIQGQIEQLQVVVGKNEETGEFSYRPAAWKDFYEAYHLPTGQALARIRELFGDNAPVVNQFLFELQQKAQSYQDAQEDERQGWEKRQQEMETTKIREQEAIAEMWEKVNSDIATKHPEWFGEDPDDTEGNELLKEGYQLVDSAYSNQSLTPQQKVLLDAHIRHRAAAFNRDQHRIARLTSRITELEEKLGGKKASAPGAIRKEGGESAVPTQKGILEELDSSLFDA